MNWSCTHLPISTPTRTHKPDCLVSCSHNSSDICLSMSECKHCLMLPSKVYSLIYVMWTVTVWHHLVLVQGASRSIKAVVVLVLDFSGCLTWPETANKTGLCCFHAEDELWLLRKWYYLARQLESHDICTITICPERPWRPTFELSLWNRNIKAQSNQHIFTGSL